ncbi:MAG: flagellar hook-length control protein FliK [Mariprofundus sp.]
MGTGSSGIAEKGNKAGKQATNSLFSKLMSMLDKSGKADGKSALITQTQKQSINHLQQKPQLLHASRNGLIAEVSKSMAAAAEKKAGKEVDGSTAQAVAVHTLATFTQAQTTRAGAKTIPTIVQNSKNGHATLSAGNAGQTQSLSSAKDTQVPLLTAKAEQAPLMATAKAEQAPLMATAKAEQAPLINNKVVNSEAFVPANSNGESSATKTTQNHQSTAFLNQQAVASAETTDRTLPANTTELEQHLKQSQIKARGSIATQQQSETKSKSGTEQITPFAANIQAAQQHNTSTLNQTNAVSVAQSASLEAAQTDTGAQSGDKGNQDGRSFQPLAADSRLSTSPTVSSSNFQQYLNHKPTPTMTMFDSIQHIVQSAKNGQTKLEIQLDPANLGKIRISLQSDENKQLQIHMMVDQSTTRTALDQQLPALKHALAQQGLNLSGFTMGSHGEQAKPHSQASNPQQTEKDNVDTTISSIVASRHSAPHSENGLSIHI